MTNAKKELLEAAHDTEILCAKIILETEEDITIKRRLKVGHTKEELTDFLNDLDVNYDDGYGCQNLFGTIWYKDNTWSTRFEYDGSESWETHLLPEIPAELTVSFDDLIFKAHPHYGENGTQAKLKFNNGYEISVVRFPGSYGYPKLWEAAIFNTVTNDLDYTTGLTDDVKGYLTEAEVTVFINQIQMLKPC